jgi:uncharacterized membrane protein YfcA
MTVLIGFLIALAVGLTGVGAGSVTAPVLILAFGFAPADAVGTALAFAAVIKFAVSPLYLLRSQVDWRILALLCAGGIPGVLAGTLLVGALAKQYGNVLLLLVGATVALMAAVTFYRALRQGEKSHGSDHSGWLPLIAAGIGAEVGFSSAGAGALGSLALLNLTRLTPARVVGTDMLFGLAVSLIGGGLHVSQGHFNSGFLIRLLAGGLFGAYVGAYLSSILPARPLRLILAVCLAALGTQLVVRSIP